MWLELMFDCQQILLVNGKKLFSNVIIKIILRLIRTNVWSENDEKKDIGDGLELYTFNETTVVLFIIKLW